jgi:Reverse transcriptase (RNA-dependent DNA polymerase)
MNRIIDPLQFGFQRGLSTEHILIHLTKFVGDAMNENKFSIGVFLDLKKAYDVVPHDVLLKKLRYYGINDNVLSWFASYLSNRKQCVDINGQFSKPRSINISVMQGSVLGPILFLIFINDLTKATSLKTLLFADDACSLHADKNLKT